MKKSLGVKGSWYDRGDSSKEFPPDEVCGTAAMHVCVATATQRRPPHALEHKHNLHLQRRDPVVE